MANDDGNLKLLKHMTDGLENIPPNEPDSQFLLQKAVQVMFQLVINELGAMRGGLQ